jgi:Mn-containing catalase
MFYHVKDLQFNARVSKPDPRFARLLLEQFGGSNGELKAAMQYFVQAFGARQPYPDKYDLLMDIATEEFSHLEIVGATIQMLLTGVNGQLKAAADESEITSLLNGKEAKENYIHEAMTHPHFCVLSGGGPLVTDSQGIPWSGSYVNANGDLSVDMRSNIAAESRAKIVYEYLMQFTDDPLVKETLRFLMTREIAHFQMFEAALATIQPNFPPGILQGDPKHSNTYFNMSNGAEVRGPWNQGKSSQLGEEYQYINDPLKHIKETNSLLDQQQTQTERNEQMIQEKDKQLAQQRGEEIKIATMPWEDEGIGWNKPSRAQMKNQQPSQQEQQQSTMPAQTVPMQNAAGSQPIAEAGVSDKMGLGTQESANTSESLNTLSSQNTGQSLNMNQRAPVQDSVLKKFFVDSLKDIYWAEKQLVKTLPRLKKAADSEELQQAIADHLEVTNEQVSRLEQIFEQLGSKAQGKRCEAMEGLITEGMNVMENTEEGTSTRDAALIMASQKIEHYEIASYGSLAQLAKTLGHNDIAEMLHTTLDEEKEADENLTNIAENKINTQAGEEG